MTETEQPTMFDVPPARAELSADRRRTIRRREMLAAGVHPVTGAQLAGNGETCGTCAHQVDRVRNQRWHKCELNMTKGPATDIRVGWPACELWAAEQ